MGSVVKEEYIIKENKKIIDALKKIEDNKKRFIIVLSDEEKVVGTITDGDIRRGLLEGYAVDDYILDIINRKFSYINSNGQETFNEVVELFKSDKLDFLPILDEQHKLINIITKKNMHVLLIKDQKFSIDFEFLSLDDSLLEHEIYNKPWGFYKTTFLNDYSQSKILKLNPEASLSLQEHKKREEHWVIIYGRGRLVIGETIKELKAGDYVFIPKGCKHKMTNPSKDQSLMMAEVQIGEYFGEDDIIRYEDIYGRVDKK